MKVFRWKAILPLCLLLVLFAILWLLFLDRMTARTVEIVGADLVGARVDVASADVNLTAGRVSILGLQAANRNKPYVALQHIESDSFAITPGLKAKVEKVFAEPKRGVAADGN